MNLNKRIKSLLLNLDRNQLTDASLTYDEATAVFKQLIRDVLDEIVPKDAVDRTSHGVITSYHGSEILQIIKSKRKKLGL